MNRRFLKPMSCIFFFIISFGIFAQNVNVDDLVYMTEEFPPYNYTEKNVLKGLSVELLLSIWEEMGFEEQHIKVYPWARGYQLIQKNKNHVLFSMTRTKEREKMFKWVGPIHVDKFVLIGLKDKNIQVNSLEDIKKLRIGTTRDDVAGEILKELGINVKAVDKVPDMGANVKKLLLGRIDLVSYSERGLYNFLKKNRYDTKKFAVVFICKEIGSYYAFSKNIPDSLILRFQQALDKLKFKHTQLVNKYLRD